MMNGLCQLKFHIVRESGQTSFPTKDNPSPLMLFWSNTKKFCFHMIIAIIFISCSENRIALNNTDKSWNDSMPLDTVFQWIGKHNGHVYVLDGRLFDVRVLIPDIGIIDKDRLLDILQREYYLHLVEELDNKIKVVPDKDMQYYDQYKVHDDGQHIGL